MVKDLSERPRAAHARSWMVRNRTRVSGAVAGAVLLLLASVVLGAAGTMALVSTWLLAAGLGRAFNGLHGPASWAAGTLGTFGAMVAASAALRLVSPRLHGTTVNMVMIAAPAVVGLCLLLYTRLRRIERPRPLSGSYVLVPAVVTGVFLTVAYVVGSLGEYNDVAWAMSGDARNHVAILRGILSDGGVGIATFAEYPAGVNAFTGILAGAGDRSGTVGEVMLNDIHAMASTYILAAIAIGVLIAAALLEIRRPELRDGRRISTPVLVTVLVASGSAGTAFTLGMALDDGFLSAYGALALSLAGVVVGLRYVTTRVDSGLAPFFALIASVPLTFVSWTVVAIVPMAVLAMAIGLAVRDVAQVGSGSVVMSRAMRAGWWTAVGAGIAGTVGIGLVVARFLPKLEKSFLAPGSSKVPYHLMIVVLLLVVVSIAIATKGEMVSRQMIVPLTAGLAGSIVVMWLVGLPGAGVTWTYYALKTNWLVSGSLLWVLFVPIVLRADSSPGSARGSDRYGVSALAMSIAVLLLSGSATTSQNPIGPAARGWLLPSAAVVEQAVEGHGVDGPFVFWEWSDPGNDRLGNFWGALAWGADASGDFLELPGVPGGVRIWAYFTTGQTEELCALIEGEPRITVYTRDPGLETEIATLCAVGDVTIDVDE